ncbi:FmdB family zinc ribbon protein [Desulfolucanica intricata]|uniref:FmdB family zinc ribbon protein n=1 Tax=Desulfolucanica intricata TaxID=1285191 RepID=UPI000831EEAA|nr:zinc ribbon domain-containing protein [Desulfolucanica intricata]
MPIFEYKCKACGEIFDVLQLAGKDNDQIKCPSCESSELEKLISAPFLPSSVGKPANEEKTGACCGSEPGAKGCTPGSCCGGAGVH